MAQKLDEMIKKEVASLPLQDDSEYVITSSTGGEYEIITYNTFPARVRINPAYLFQAVDIDSMNDEEKEANQDLLRYTRFRDFSGVVQNQNVPRGLLLKHVMQIWSKQTTNENLKAAIETSLPFVESEGLQQPQKLATDDDGSKLIQINDGEHEKIVIATQPSDIIHANWPYLLALMSPYRMDPKDARRYMDVIEFCVQYPERMVVQALKKKVASRTAFLRYAIQQKLKDPSLPKNIQNALNRILRYAATKGKGTSEPPDGKAPPIIRRNTQACIQPEDADVSYVNWLSLLYIVDLKNMNTGRKSFHRILDYVTKEKYEICIDSNAFPYKSAALNFALNVLLNDERVEDEIRKEVAILLYFKEEKGISSEPITSDEKGYVVKIVKKKNVIVRVEAKYRLVNPGFLFKSIDVDKYDEETDEYLQTVLDFAQKLVHTTVDKAIIYEGQTRAQALETILKTWKRDDDVPENVKDSIDGILPYINFTGSGSRKIAEDDKTQLVTINDGLGKRIVIREPKDEVLFAYWPYLLSEVNQYSMAPEDSIMYQKVINEIGMRQVRYTVHCLRSKCPTRSAFLDYALKQMIKKRSKNDEDSRDLIAINKYVVKDQNDTDPAVSDDPYLAKIGGNYYFVRWNSSYQFTDWPKLMYIYDYEGMNEQRRPKYDTVLKYVLENQYTLFIDTNAFSSKSDVLKYVLGYISKDEKVPENIRQAAAALPKLAIEKETVAKESIKEDARKYVIMPIRGNKYKVDLITDRSPIPNVNTAPLFLAVDELNMGREKEDAWQALLEFAVSRHTTDIPYNASERRGTVLKRVLNSWAKDRRTPPSVVEAITSTVIKFVREDGPGAKNLSADPDTMFSLIKDGVASKIVITNKNNLILTASWPYLLQSFKLYEMEVPDGVAYQTVLDFYASNQGLMEVQATQNRVTTRDAFLRYALQQKQRDKNLPAKIRTALKKLLKIAENRKQETDPPTGPSPQIVVSEKHVCLKGPGSNIGFVNWIDIDFIFDEEFILTSKLNAFHSLVKYIETNKIRYILDNSTFSTYAEKMKYVLTFISKDPDLPAVIRNEAHILNNT